MATANAARTLCFWRRSVAYTPLAPVVITWSPATVFRGVMSKACRSAPDFKQVEICYHSVRSFEGMRHVRVIASITVLALYAQCAATPANGRGCVEQRQDSRPDRQGKLDAGAVSRINPLVSKTSQRWRPVAFFLSFTSWSLTSAEATVGDLGMRIRECPSSDVASRAHSAKVPGHAWTLRSRTP
jgi:hypothetical protein